MVKHELVQVRDNRTYFDLYIATQKYLKDNKDDARLKRFSDSQGGLELTCLPAHQYFCWTINSSGLSSQPQLMVRAHDRVIDVNESSSMSVRWMDLATSLARVYESVLKVKGIDESDREFTVRRLE